MESTLTLCKDIEVNGKLSPSPNFLSLSEGLPPSYSHFIVDPESAKAKFDTLCPLRCMEVKEAIQINIV
jgi:hypothetical protein